MLRLFIVGLNIFVCSGVSEKEYSLMPKLFHLDDFDDCMRWDKRASYCKFTFELRPLAGDNSIWRIIQNASSDPRNYRHDRLRHGICLPAACRSDYLRENNSSINEIIETCYNRIYKSMGLEGNVTQAKCQRNEPGYRIDFYDIIFGVFFISYFLAVLLASIYEGTARYQKKEVYQRIVNTPAGKIISSFSIPRNWHRLTSINTSIDAKRLQSIQGIRFYNMICVILSHTIMVTFAGPVSNPQYAEKMTGKPLNMYLANGNYVVQTFFLISGWLLSFHFFETMENRKTLNLKYIGLALINRYIRLTPTLAAMIAFESTWLGHIGTGPYWNELVVIEKTNCRSNWWTNLLYINNYIDKNNMCLHQSWYIAADTQLYAFSLILLTIIWKYEKYAKLVFGSTIAVGILIPAAIAYFKNYDIIIRQYPEVLYEMNGLKVPAWHDLYSSGYSNITGYAIGLTFGYVFYKTRNKNLKITKFHHILWWVLTFGMCDFIILIASKMYSPDYRSSRLESALYWALGKNVFALGLAVGIFGFSNKIGWFARWFCEWRSVSVIGRLTYSTYIVHSAVVRVRGGFIRSPTFVNDYLLLTTTLGDIALSYLIGTLVCLLFEMPVSSLQKLMVPQRKFEDSEEKTPKLLNQEETNGSLKEKSLL